MQVQRQILYLIASTCSTVHREAIDMSLMGEHRKNAEPGPPLRWMVRCLSSDRNTSAPPTNRLTRSVVPAQLVYRGVGRCLCT